MADSFSPGTGNLNLPIDPADLPRETYCVGGWVRDCLLGRQPLGETREPRPKVDIDFVLPAGSIDTARQIARKYKAPFVLLDREREIARVVLPQGNLDFAKQVGATLLDDLRQRDFCMNAMAVPVHRPGEIIDPHDGIGDLQQKIVRMVSPENIAADPLRILRAYRQAAQLNFTIEPWTHQTIKQLAPLLPQVAIERIRMELTYLLQSDSDWLLTCLEDQIFSPWLPSTKLRLDRFCRLAPTIGQILARYPLQNYFCQAIVNLTLKYAALVPSASMWDFLGLSRQEQKWITTLLRYLPQLPSAENSPLEQYYLFSHVGEMLPALFALARADGIPVSDLWLDRWLNPHDPIAHPATLVTGDDLQQFLAIKPGPRLGQLLIAIREAQILQIVNDREQALEFAKTWWQSTS
ncbi:MAG: CCA tRNA nucleotidyltransferase [Pseudanabaenaceae cyanobacterium SKYGB_i_bin29]|nr:CCA tRNA nucleotidyltransferase [Pseudanabaenaceae cyanobacterium SKYG29]MDW8420824.1 CCA tRNA nucleotidyltransferase [Pseudanabaenaceae cyanobacterium SKYGB_i_bin29]